MEFFNMIWNAISTPNETLINIFLVFATFFIEIPLTFSIITSIFKIEYIKRQKYIYILSASIVSILNMFVLNNPYNIVFNYVFNFIIIYLVFHISKLKTLIVTIFPSIIFNVLGSLLLNFYLTILNISYEEVNSIPIYRIPFTLLMYLIVFLFTLILKYKNITIKILDNFDIKSNFKFYIWFSKYNHTIYINYKLY